MDVDMCRLLLLKRVLDVDDVSTPVEIEDEAVVTLETLNSQKKSIPDVYSELEEERSCAATTASEALSMILRLQREKVESEMEFRQFKKLAEEKLSHDQEEILALEDLLLRKEEEILAYRQQFRFGFSLFEPQQTPDTTNVATYAAGFDYPSLRCKVRSGNCVENEYVGETPRDRVSNIEQRICQMERMPSGAHEKGAIRSSPCKERVCVMDKVHCWPGSYVSTPRDFGSREVEEEEEIKRLYVRLLVLEADREMMRQPIASMGTDKAQLLLLK